MKLFGTDGIRGKSNSPPMVPEFMCILARALSIIMREEKIPPKVFIAKDTRISSSMLESGLIGGFLSMDVDVFRLGVLTTPAVAYFTKSMKAGCGIAVSASHNPYDEAGVKIVGKDGFKLADKLEERIENLLKEWGVYTESNLFNLKSLPYLAENKIGKVIEYPDATGRYVKFLLSSVDKITEKFKIVIDCANGSAYKLAEILFKKNLPTKSIFINNKPNGYNINASCGSMYPEVLRERVLKEGADLGLALDGDGDRLILVDQKGNIRDGDDILFITAKYLKERNKLENNKVVATVMSNLALELELKELGIEIIRCAVGDRYVADTMRREAACLGGEASGHIIFFKHTTTGDGLLTALQILQIIQDTQKDLYTLCNELKKFPQILTNLPVKEKKEIEDLPKTQRLINEIIDRYQGGIRIIVRPSGTEQMMRVLVEGEDRNVVEEITQKISQTLIKEL